MTNINGPLYQQTREIPGSELPDDKIESIEDERLRKLAEAGIDESAVIAEIHKNRGAWSSYFEENNVKGKEDLEFLYRDQWTSIERSEFDRCFKPALVINKLYDPVNKILTEQRDNTPDPKVRSLTGKATQDSINLHTDMLKRIAYSSNTKEIYQQTFQSQITFSYGVFLVDIEYQSPHTFHQEIIYRWKSEPEKCFFDPRAMQSHKGDGDYFGYTLTMGKEEYDAKYPNCPHPTSFSDPQTLTQFQWYSNDVVVLAEYWVKEYYTQVLYKLADGSEVTEDEYDEIKKQLKSDRKGLKNAIFSILGEESDLTATGMMVEDLLPQMQIVDERIADNYRIMHYRCTADKVLEFEEWPSKFLPGIFAAGATFYEQGQQYTRSFIAQAKDAQRTVNYLACDIAGRFKNSSRGQWLGTPTNVNGPAMELEWQNPELQQGILLANPDPDKGGDPMPTYLPPAEIPQSLFIHYQRATNDVFEVLGVHDEMVGAANSVVAQKTVQQRSLQSSKSAGIFFQNLDRAVEQGLKICLDMMASVYDTERTMTLTRANGDQYTITINQEMPDGSTQNKIQSNDFDVELDAGPSFAVQKQQALEMMMQVFQAAPQTFPLFADLFFKNMDLQFSQQMIERAKTLVPPAVLAKEQGLPPPPPPPNPQEMFAQKQMQLADAKIAAETQNLQLRAAELQLKKEREELERAKLMFQLTQLQHEMHKTAMDDSTENKKALLNYSAQMSRLVADMQKQHTPSNN